MATHKLLFLHCRQKYSFVELYFLRYGFSIIWAMLCPSSWFKLLNFFQIQKSFFFSNPHHSDKKWSIITEFLTKFKRITFLIRIIFFTNLGMTKWIGEHDLYHPSYRLPLCSHNVTYNFIPFQIIFYISEDTSHSQ